jgi:hypothetical protein
MSQKKSGPDWTSLGKLVAMLVTLFALVRDTFAKMGVGLEIIGWIIGDGKKAFVADFLQPLGQKFLDSRPKQVITRVMVDLGAFPKLPFDGASVLSHATGGVVALERRVDGVYLDGKKLGFYLSERQMSGKTVQGLQLRDEVTGQPVVTANVLDALYEYTELIPEEWKVDEQGRIRYIFFWGTIYRDSGGLLCVRCLFFGGGAWRRFYRWLDGGWGGQNPALVRAS